jgi:hypothetical protein
MTSISGIKTIHWTGAKFARVESPEGDLPTGDFLEPTTTISGTLLRLRKFPSATLKVEALP